MRPRQTYRNGKCWDSGTRRPRWLMCPPVHGCPRQNTRLARESVSRSQPPRPLFSSSPMFFAPRASPRHASDSPPSAQPSNHQRDTSRPSSASPVLRVSRDSESYPSWLPRRPPPPAPTSTMHSSNGLPEPDPDTDPELFASLGGRKPTSRSVRIVSLQGVKPPGSGKPSRLRTDNSRPRVWSRATAPRPPSSGSPGEFSSPYYTSLRIPQPKFNAKTLDLNTIVTPSLLARLYFNLFPLLVFTHLPLQTYFDFNAVFCLIECVPLSLSLPLFASPLSQTLFWRYVPSIFVSCLVLYLLSGSLMLMVSS